MPSYRREPSTEQLFDTWRAAERVALAAEIAAGRSERIAADAERAAIAAEQHSDAALRALRVAHDRYTYRMDELELAGEVSRGSPRPEPSRPVQT